MSSNSPNTLEYATEWESVREKIRDSRFYNTHLNELAKEWGLTWPVKRHNETPAKYLHHTWEELEQVPTLKKSKKRRELLLKILENSTHFNDQIECLEYDVEAIATHPLDSVAKPSHKPHAPTHVDVPTPADAETEITHSDETSWVEQETEVTSTEPETTQAAFESTDPDHPSQDTLANEAETTPTPSSNDNDQTETKEDAFNWDNFDFENDEAPTDSSSVLDPLHVLKSNDGETSEPETNTPDEELHLEKPAQSEVETEPASWDEPEVEADLPEPIAPEETAPPVSKPRYHSNTQSEGIISDSMIHMLDEWGIPIEFPVELMGLSPEEQTYCQKAEVNNLRELVDFYEKEEENQSFLKSDEKESQIEIHIKSLCRSILIGNENEVSTLLPIRANAKGIHLPEAIQLLIKTFPRQYQTVLLNRMGSDVMLECCDEGVDSTRDDVKDMEIEFLTKSKKLMEWFPKTKEVLWNLWANGEPLQDFFDVYEEPHHMKAAAKSVCMVFESSPEGQTVLDARKKLFKSWISEIEKLNLQDQEAINLTHFLGEKQKANLLEEFALFGKKNRYFEYSFIKRELVPGEQLHHQGKAENFRNLFCEKTHCESEIFEKRVLSNVMRRGSVTLPLFLAIKRGGFEEEREIINRVADAKTFRQFNREVDTCFNEKTEESDNKANLTITKDALLKLGKKIFE